MVKAIVGANWGDEGKGKITDVLAGDSDVVIRFQGGSNAGHTIVNEHGRFALHQLPSGVFYPHVTNLIGNGVALDLGKFLQEVASLQEAGTVSYTHLDVYKRQALHRAGATFEGEENPEPRGEITKADLYALGLSGGPDSSRKRLALLRALHLPEHMSTNAMLQALNLLYTRQELEGLLEVEG